MGGCSGVTTWRATRSMKDQILSSEKPAHPSQHAFPFPDDSLLLRWLAEENKARLIVNAALKLIWANRAGQKLLEDGILLKNDGQRITATSDELRIKIEQAVKSKTPESTILQQRDEVGNENILVRVKILQEAEDRVYFGLQVLCHALIPDGWLRSLSEHFQLTRKQSEILRHLIAGKSMAETAFAMAISIETARTHVRDVYAKLNVSSREELFARVRPFYL